MRTYYLILAAGLILTGLSCDPEPTPPQPTPLDLSCVELYDANGVPFGPINCSVSNHWTNIPLSSSERDLLNFSDTVSLAGTSNANINQLAIYPVPIVRGNVFSGQLLADEPDRTVKIKLTIIDENSEVKLQRAFRTNTSNGFALQVDPAIFQNGQYYRIYYLVSSQSDESLFEGYGNVLVCKTFIEPGVTTIEADCL